MALAAGTRLGAYEITASLGAGGMGEVYRARDSRLKRDVALKVLPDQLAADPERRARFQREAEILAGLTHPNIAALYGLEEIPSLDSRTTSTGALVMELVEGETLSDRIATGPVPPEEALALSQQVADALDYAHEHGVLHRDLKPANIKVTAEGQVKLLDFGLAKAFDQGSGIRDQERLPTRRPSRARLPPVRGRSWGPRPTCRPSRCAGASSTGGPTSGRSAA
jgi:serine/threonine-protein kinase